MQHGFATVAAMSDGAPTLTLRPLSDAEITVRTAASATPFVLDAGALGARAAADLWPFALPIRGALERHGALLLRGLPVHGAADFERCLRALDVELTDRYDGGATPRSKVGGAVFTSTELAAPFMIGYHTEQCYLTTRPRIIAFHCETAPPHYGETPVFDCAEMLRALPAELRAKLERTGVRYRRFFPAKRGLLNFKKPWPLAFGTPDRAAVEALLRADGTSFRWLPDGGLMTELTVPAVLTDPIGGRRCLSLTVYDTYTFPYNFRHFAARYGPLRRRLYTLFTRLNSETPKPFMRTLFGDGTPLSRAESEAIQRAAWQHAILFRWQRGDVLLLDNIRFGHGRLNVVEPRAILAALGAPYDVRSLVPAG